ncbi:protease synthase and sporulation negative regulatory PAI 1 domain protein [Lactobacillus selangorensis]|uniref:Protease synthase and sporulation negative regulatory PAI 1 domain protein n=1 Tax=Lactobacillus selangorensis TaxID=81857 RepID=A0A0R2FKP6_9LACO|nr:GNAT family N-acetyltransferase [Lactobacillus selangorensis]KRN28830.1 protease synthase and sporulation negative regulatory PAI 1 domain protein [Lactobacillus selangorensis]KRN32760.1 protease synthase and sporulation negative regulatory PAI 1 domain protein [Lactobacillus selangorensis]
MITPMTLTDLPELQKISRITFADTFGAANTAANMDEYLDSAYRTAKLTAELTDPDSFFFFIKQDNHNVGYLKVNVNSAQTETMGSDTLEIERIYILPAYKHRGLGTQLIHQALAVAQQQHKTKIWLGVWEHNEPAKKFYQKMGFHQIGDHIFQLGTDKQRDLMLLKQL